MDESIRLSIVSIVDIVGYGDNTLKDNGVGSHRSCQIQILFMIPTHHLKPFSKTNLAATMLSHASFQNLMMSLLSLMY